MSSEWASGSGLQRFIPPVELGNAHLAKSPGERHHLVTFDGYSPMVACCPSTESAIQIIPSLQFLAQ